MLMGCGFCFAVSAIFFLGKNIFLGFFTTEAAVLDYAVLRMTYVVLLEWMTGLNEIPASCLRGMGVSMPPTIISIMGSCVFRVIWVKTIFRMNPVINILMIVYPVSWILICIFTMSLYFVARKKRLAFE